MYVWREGCCALLLCPSHVGAKPTSSSLTSPSPPSTPTKSTGMQDTNKDDPSASKKFMEITEAYEVLGDEKKRQVTKC